MVGLSICRMSTSQGQSHLTTRLPTGVRNQPNQRMPVSRTMVDCPRNTIPGLSEWPIRFDSENSDSNDPSGWFNVPYIWLLALRATYHYQGDFFFEELQLLDFGGLRAIAKEDPTLPGGFSWTKLKVKIRKIKSHVFDDSETVTTWQLHRGAIMDHETEGISFVNHHHGASNSRFGHWRVHRANNESATASADKC